jgi:pantoate--beta-alanine ligase
MDVIQQLSELRKTVTGWRSANQRVALVPTMGNLHAGHLSLVREASKQADRVVVSIFVNPMQFGPNEDFAAYPRTLEQDCEVLRPLDVAVVFAPPVEVVYPGRVSEQTRVEVPGISDILCGASRPGHFTGVATVVCKLFNMVQPDLAVFGEKDYQQLLVIRRMTQDLCLPVEIKGMPTQRDSDGLAMSSRNGYLSAAERAQAPALRRCLLQAAELLKVGGEPAKVESSCCESLEKAGFEIDYFSVRRADDLQPVGAEDMRLVVLAAAFLGKTRLIDNLAVSR